MKTFIFRSTIPALLALWTAAANGVDAQAPPGQVLNTASFKHFVDSFNQTDADLHAPLISSAKAWDFLKDNVPRFDCPDPDINEVYYFRWWTYCKHIQKTPAGFIITEFLPPVSWAGKYNSIACAAGHHFHEGRWLADSRVLDDYSMFWFRNGGEPRRYSFWAAEALWARYLVTGDDRTIKELLPDLIANYEAWARDHRDANGLFWQTDDRDGMEVSVGGNGYRPTINSYMYGDAVAIANIARLSGQQEAAERFLADAAEIKRLVQEKLWDPQAQFFEVLPRSPNDRLRGVREELGYTPWYFNLPDRDKAAAWSQLMDSNGFRAPFGPTTLERRSSAFRISYQGHECQWNGPSWPFATSVTLTALANLLDNYDPRTVARKDYFDLFKIYTRSQHRPLDDGRVVPWIDEDLNPTNGDWIARTILKQRGSKIPERGKDYNHSTYCDLVISGLVGLRPRADEVVEVNPLAPSAWDYFCLDQVRYHGRWLTILWDKTGEHYKRGKGLRVLANGMEIAAADALGRLTATLSPPHTGATEATNSTRLAGVDASARRPYLTGPTEATNSTRLAGVDASARRPYLTGATASTNSAANAAWEKYSGNPVIGGTYGTCFDVSVLKEDGTYRLWLSWRPKRSIALVESKDGFHWSQPPRIVLGPRKETGWENDINRPVVIKRDGGYHLWYTGQARGGSWIGYATSPDGAAWQRMSDNPVLSPDQPWEKVAVMCPDVIWDGQARMFRMWYSAGEQYEPDAIGYATSADGISWIKHPGNPVFSSDPTAAWEHYKVTACQIVEDKNWFLMFYIGFRDVDHAQIGLARSKDGISHWERNPANPIVHPDPDAWDHDACYKPYAIFDGQKWLLWYNGRHASLEQIGVAMHNGPDLGFPRSAGAGAAAK